MQEKQEKSTMYTELLFQQAQVTSFPPAKIETPQFPVIIEPEPFEKSEVPRQGQNPRHALTLLYLLV